MNGHLTSFGATHFAIMPPSNSWLIKLDKILQQHIFITHLEIKFLATSLNLSTRHFHRKVKKLSGLTANQYVRNYRLNAAMKQLESGNYLTVSEIGQAVGFTNIYYFSKLFEKKFGETPMNVLKRLGHR